MLHRFAWPLAFVAIAAMAFGYARDRDRSATSDVRVEHEGATVVREVRALSKLETSALHVEKVIELSDHQRRLRGLLDVEDSLLFVAVGEVVLGVDFGKVGSDDVRFDPSTGVAHLTLPAPEVLSTRFDEDKSYVHSRKTDTLARRNEGLEASARREALAAFRTAGADPAAVDSAKVSAERQLRALARGWGAKDLVIRWKGPSGEVAVTTADDAG